MTSAPTIRLRDVVADDLGIFFEHQRDPVASHMAAFTSRDPEDRAAFDAHWQRILADETILTRTIVVDGQVVGSVASFERVPGRPEVTYWIAREHWGKGIATAALRAFLNQVARRPIHAGAARDNVASLRVLEKCGFVVCGRERGFARARGAEIDELLLVLNEERRTP